MDREKSRSSKVLYVAFGAILFFLCCGYVLGQQSKIKCYQCNSFYDKGCADFFDNQTYPLKPCGPNVTMCRKIVQETYFDGMWDIRYIRQCATKGEVGPDEGIWCKERVGTFRVKVKYCHCDNKDGCNTGANLLPHTGLLSAVSVLTVTHLQHWIRTWL